MSRARGWLAWLGSVRGQLILGVALVHALMMALFVWDLTERHESLLLQRQSEQAGALAASLAVSSAGWLAARDVAGLQEIINAQSRYPELEFAMLLDNSGLILAHSEKARIGRYVHDLPAGAGPRVMSRSAALVDVFEPAMLGSRRIGWVRVGIGQRIAGDRLAEITRDGMLYALAAILLGALMAGWLGARMTRKLYAIRAVTETVINGAGNQRVPALGRDEVAELAQDFNAMLDTLQRRDAELTESSREIAASQAQLHALINAIPDLVWLKDGAGRYLFCNPRFEQFFGAGKARILGRTDYDFIDRELADAFRAKDERVMLSDQAQVNEEWITFADDGHRELVETIKLPLRAPDGRLIGVLGIARDITERKHSEDLQRYAAFQSGVAEMGVSVLHNIGNAITAMSDDARALQQAGEDCGRLSGLLKRGLDDSQARQTQGGSPTSELERMQAIQREAARTLQHLGEQVLQVRGENIVLSVQHIADIVRIQQTAALPSASASTFDLARAIENALTLQGDSLRQNGIRIEVAIDAELTEVTLAHNQFLQALLNVVKNAHESILQRQQHEAFAGEISLRALALGQGRMRLSVRDNGAGFAPELQPQLFRYGFSTKTRGTGFGLHATALFVQEMGGSISLTSEGPNRGATLSMELPCAAKELPPTGVNGGAESAASDASRDATPASAVATSMRAPIRYSHAPP
jgi:PAS domain S-box-containing protein